MLIGVGCVYCAFRCTSVGVYNDIQNEEQCEFKRDGEFFSKESTVWRTVQVLLAMCRPMSSGSISDAVVSSEYT